MTLTLSLGMGGILFSVSPNDGMITYLMIYGNRYPEIGYK